MLMRISLIYLTLVWYFFYFLKINIISFGNQTLENNISVFRYRTEMLLYWKQSYGYQFSKEYGQSTIEAKLTKAANFNPEHIPTS